MKKCSTHPGILTDRVDIVKSIKASQRQTRKTT
jgi:hypothetical protein